MVGTRATKRTKPQKEIKQEEEDEEEWQNSTTPKRRCTEENALEKRKIKEEEEEEEVEDEEWSDEDEPSESDESIVDPDFDPEGRHFSDDSGDDLRKKRNTDGDDLRKRRNANVDRDNGGEELSWGFRSAPDHQPDPLRFKPARTAGPALDATFSWTPLSVFQLFCSASVIRKIVENTNKNGARRKEAGIMKKWTSVTVKDFHMYLVTLLYTGLVKLHNHSDYWRKVWPYRFQFPAEAMSRERFDEIRITLSLCDPEEDEKNESKKGTPEYDKLFKIQPFYTELVDACKAHFQPHRNICVHERKAAKKPLKCGYRLFALADSLTGYTWNLHIDTGKTAATRGQTAGYTAVKNLLPVSAIGSGITLYTESLFSSPRLFTELLDQNIGCCGS
uniref:PiggyBac transposable element-derived protein domain-containing protein n=1 Tax=Neogobius melanostomus TaxID=47308 RepID=A0A8C6T1I6_9GOBI